MENKFTTINIFIRVTFFIHNAIQLNVKIGRLNNTYFAYKVTLIQFYGLWTIVNGN